MAVTTQQADTGRRSGTWRNAFTFRKVGFFFALPATLVFVIFLLYPVLFSLLMAFTNWTGFNFQSLKFVGVGNFTKLGHDPIFWRALWQTMAFVVATTVVLNLLGLFFAIAVDTRVRGAGFFKAVLFFPVLLSPVIVGITWSRMLDNFGIVNQVLRSLHILKTPIPWLGEPSWALPAIIVATIWQWTAYDMVIYYAGLQSIPQHLHEAAAIDGANGWTRIVKITVPLLAPVMTVVMLLNFIGGIRIFDIVFVMTRGGPNRHTEALATYLYEQGFKINVAGYASAIAVVIVVIAFAVTYVRLKTAGGGEEL